MLQRCVGRGMMRRMSEANSTAQLLLARYGAIAYRLAAAVLGEGEEAESVVLHSSSSASHWAGFLAAVHAGCRERARERMADADASSDAPPPSAVLPEVRDPGDLSASPLPLEASAVYGAFQSLEPHERTLLWQCLLDPRAAPPPRELARALEALATALVSWTYPSEEDIP